MEKKVPMFEVINGGMMTTVQDLGRPGYGSKGIPPSGAFDAFSLKAGNLLLRNELGEAGLEVLGIGLRLKALSHMAVVITGGDLCPKLNNEDIEMWRVIGLYEGDVLTFSRVKSGCRAYVTVSGGIDVPPLLGSKSTFLRGGMGGYEGRMIKKGDVLKIGQPKISLLKLEGRKAAPALVRHFGHIFNIRAVRGLEDFLFVEESVELFFSAQWQVTPLADRMGVRYQGADLCFKPRDEVMDHEGGRDPSNILNECIPTGGIQIVSGRQPIVLAIEGPPTGGYAKIGTVISCDLSWVAQSKPGDSTFFKAVKLDEAHQILREEQSLFQESSVIID
jgi:antagonist of KipI